MGAEDVEPEQEISDRQNAWNATKISVFVLRAAVATLGDIIFVLRITCCFFCVTTFEWNHRRLFVIRRLDVRIAYSQPLAIIIMPGYAQEIPKQ